MTRSLTMLSTKMIETDGKQQTPSSVISQEKLSGQQMRRSSKPRLM